MAIHSHGNGHSAAVGVRPQFSLAGEMDEVPRQHLREGELPPDVAYQICHDELMLDGNARLNLATFVSTWMEPAAKLLMSECFDKNMIDRTSIRRRRSSRAAVSPCCRTFFHAPDGGGGVGCSTTGSSEAAMLAGLALKRRWQNKNKGATGTPNLVMGANVQVCWEKFARYWDVEMRLVNVGPETTG